MEHFLIITNIYKDKDLRLTKKIEAYVKERGGACDVFLSNGEGVENAAPETVSPKTDGVLVLGGDGTLIRAASRLVGQGLAFIGVNLGKLGYLCELEETNLFPAIDKLMQGQYLIEERMMLSGYGISRGEKTAQKVALNDVVIHRAGGLSVVDLIVSVNGEYLNTYHADGMILSTPTGSTGYNLSAGGPIVDPKAKMLLITPINAHNLNARSIVVGAGDEVSVEIGARGAQREELVRVSFDGDDAAALGVGDKFFVRQAEETARICRLSNMSFLEILRKKMQNYT